MTINTQTGISDVMLGDGVNLVFPFGFKIATASEIDVYVDGQLIDETAYTVTLSLDWSGSVTFDTAPVDDAEVVLASNPAFVQASEHLRQGPFYPDVVEDDLDRATLRDIFLKRETDRAFKLPLLNPDSQAGKFPVVLPDGSQGFSTGTGADAGLRVDLAAPDGPNHIGFSRDETFAPETLGAMLMKRAPRITDAPYNCVPDGTTDWGAAINAAILDRANDGGGDLVYPAHEAGLSYRTGQKLIGRNRVRHVGEHYSCTSVMATDTFNDVALFANQNQDGTQQYCSVIGIGFHGNKGGGAICSEAVLRIGSVFEGSEFDEILVQEGSHKGAYFTTSGGFGPVKGGAIWCIRNNDENFMYEKTGSGAATGFDWRRITVEHNVNNKPSLHIKGAVSGVFIGVVHTEQVTPVLNSKRILLDGCSDVNIGLIEMLAGAATAHTGLEISATSSRVQVGSIYNINTVSNILNDLKSGKSFGAVNVAGYKTSDFGVYGNSSQILPYSASITPDVLLGNHCIIVASDANPFTIKAPLNMAEGEDLSFEIVDASGSAMGAVTWENVTGGYNYKNWVNPSAGYRRTITFRKRGGGLVQLGDHSQDLQ